MASSSGSFIDSPKALKLTLGAWPSSEPGRLGVFPPIGEPPDFCVGGFQGTPPGKPTFVDLFEGYVFFKNWDTRFWPRCFSENHLRQARGAALRPGASDASESEEFNLGQWRSVLQLLREESKEFAKGQTYEVLNSYLVPSHTQKAF